MKNLITIICLLGVSHLFAQPIAGVEIKPVDIKKIEGTHDFITLDSLEHSHTLSDLFRLYRHRWVGEYYSVALNTTCGDETRTEVGDDHHLTSAQLELLKQCTNDCDIEFLVDYLPKNNLKDNPPRQMKFTLTMIPIYEAKFPGGITAMQEYLEAKTVDVIPDEIEERVELVKIRFTIDKEGFIIDPHFLETSGLDDVDQALMKTVCNMPQWIPAKDNKGNTIAQNFEFSFGKYLLQCERWW